MGRSGHELSLCPGGVGQELLPWSLRLFKELARISAPLDVLFILFDRDKFVGSRAYCPKFWMNVADS